MIDVEEEQLAPVGELPPRALIVTIFGFYVREAGGWVSVGSLIRLMAAFGVDAQAVRSSVSRLKRRGILVGERRGNVAGYGLSAYARDVLATGDRRIFSRPEGTDDDWAVVVFSVPETERQKRHELRSRLSWLGFGTVAAGVWIAPGHLADETREVLAGDGLDRYVDMFRAGYVAFGDPAEKVARWWDLDGLDSRYRQFLQAQAPVLQRWTRPGADAAAAPEQAFVDYLRALTEWRRLPYLDPGLPARLLPASWSGAQAADTFFDLRRLLADPAHTFASSQA